MPDNIESFNYGNINFEALPSGEVRITDKSHTINVSEIISGLSAKSEDQQHLVLSGHTAKISKAAFEQALRNMAHSFGVKPPDIEPCIRSIVNKVNDSVTMKRIVDIINSFASKPQPVKKTTSPAVKQAAPTLAKPAPPVSLAGLDTQLLPQITVVCAHLGGSTGAQTVQIRGKPEKYVAKDGIRNPGQLLAEYHANKAYKILGIPVPEVTLFHKVLSESLSTQNSKGEQYPVMLAAFQEGMPLDKYLDDPSVPDDLKELTKQKLREGFVADCLMKNWDAIGLLYDNIIVQKDGTPVRIDNGGCLEFRASGEPKPGGLDEEVKELDSMRDPNINPAAAKIYGGISNEDIISQIDRLVGKREHLLKVLPQKYHAVMEKRFLFLERYKKELLAEKVEHHTVKQVALDAPKQAVLFNKKFSSETLFLNKIALKPSPPVDWSQIPDVPGIDPLFSPKNKHLETAAGVIIQEPDGRLWVYEPKSHFGGYENTFPKGRREKGLTLQQTAIKEAFEETGLQVQITGFLMDQERTTTNTRFYLAKRVSGDPSQAHWEAENVKLVPPEQLGALLNSELDHEVMRKLAPSLFPQKPVMQRAKDDAISKLDHGLISFQEAQIRLKQHPLGSYIVCTISDLPDSQQQAVRLDPSGELSVWSVEEISNAPNVNFIPPPGRKPAFDQSRIATASFDQLWEWCASGIDLDGEKLLKRILELAASKAALPNPTRMHQLFDKAAEQLLKEKKVEMSFQASARAAAMLRFSPEHPLYNLSREIEIRNKKQADDRFGAYFSKMDTTIVDGQHIRAASRKVKGKNIHHVQFEICDYAKAKLHANLKAILDQPKLFSSALPGLLSKGKITINDDADYVFMGSDPRTGEFSEASGYKPPGAKAIEIVFEGIGKVIIPRPVSSYKSLQSEITIELDASLKPGEGVQAMQEMISMLGLGPVMCQSNLEDIAKQKVALLFRTYYPLEALELEKSQAFYDQPLNVVIEQICKMKPDMKSKLDNLDKMPETEIFAGQQAWMTPVGSEVRRAGGWGLMMGIGEDATIDQAADTAIAISQKGAVSSKRRFLSGNIVKGASIEEDLSNGGADEVFTRLVGDRLSQKSINKYMYNGTIQILYDLDAVNSGAYGYHLDNFGTKHKDESAKNLVASLAELPGKIGKDIIESNEVMVHHRIGPEHIRGYVVASEADKKVLAEKMARSGFKITVEPDRFGKETTVVSGNGLKAKIHVIPPDKPFQKGLWSTL